MAPPPPPVVAAFAVVRGVESPLSPPAVEARGPLSPALLESLAALDAESRGDGARATVPEFLSRALGGGARRADVFVARCRRCSAAAAAACDDGGRCCGYLVSRRIGPRAARVSALGVRPECRRKGLATALVLACARKSAEGAAAAATPAAASAAAAAAVAAAAGAPVALTLAVARGNAAARALYARLGFVRAAGGDGGGEDGRGGDEDDIEMEASLLLPPPA